MDGRRDLICEDGNKSGGIRNEDRGNTIDKVSGR